MRDDTTITDEKLILSQIQQLPEQLKREVLHYVEFLQTKNTSQKRNPKKREAGSLKGKYKLSPDFDAPLEDFKNYNR